MALDSAGFPTRHLGGRWIAGSFSRAEPETTHRFPHMHRPLILASGSAVRRRLLQDADVPVEVVVPRVDEDSVRDALVAEGASPRDVADALEGRILAKPATPEEARAQLAVLNGKRHKLHSAVVVCEDGKPVWRHVGEVRLTMRSCSDSYLDDYIARNWESVRDAVGSYKLEEEGVRLFSRIEGDYFTVLGLPLLELLSYLTLRGRVPG
jgi:septum formation protein